jgi:hypothetical protein
MLDGGDLSGNGGKPAGEGWGEAQRSTTTHQSSKGLILLGEWRAHLYKTLILHTDEIGTFCIDCTGTPERGTFSRFGMRE